MVSGGTGVVRSEISAKDREAKKGIKRRTKNENVMGEKSLEQYSEAINWFWTNGDQSLKNACVMVDEVIGFYL